MTPAERDGRDGARSAARSADLAGLDPRRELDVDHAAGRLLERFYRHGDVGAFRELALFAHPRLQDLARAVGRAAGVAFAPDALADRFLAELFADPARERAPAEPFLAHARARLDALARRHAAAVADSYAPGEAPDPADPALECVVSSCFHAMGETPRRILLLRAVDGLDYDALAREVSVTREEVAGMVREARRELARRVRAALGEAAP